MKIVINKDSPEYGLKEGSVHDLPEFIAKKHIASGFARQFTEGKPELSNKENKVNNTKNKKK